MAVVLWWREDSGGVGLAVSDRVGGVSAGPYDGLNLGGHVGDDPTAVAANRRALAARLGVGADRLVSASQVHGSSVVHVTGPWPGPVPEADALVTDAPGTVLAVLVADCVPVLLSAPRERLVGVAHAGRRGMVDGVAVAAVEALRDLGATQVEATLGPSVCPRCYEVPAALRDEVAARAPLAASVTWRGTPAVDVAAGVLAQLAPLCARVRQLPGCTVEDRSLFSHRRDGRTGRFAGLAWLEAP
ncbi:peptidoglycan editing factor PgeF [Thalassiella azotivora]